MLLEKQVRFWFWYTLRNVSEAISPNTLTGFPSLSDTERKSCVFLAPCVILHTVKKHSADMINMIIL